MKRLIYFAYFIFITMLAACSKNSPAPSNSGSTNNGNGNTGNQGSTGGTTTGGSFGFDAAFNPPTGFTSAHAFEQADGKIVIDAYSTVNSKAVIEIYRLNTDGKLDNSFNIDVDKSWIINSLNGIFVLANGQILLGGSFTVNNQTTNLVRLNSNGAIDKTYTPPTGFNGYSNIAFQRTADGKVFVSYTTPFTGLAITEQKAWIIRLNNDGSLDASFNLPTTNVPTTNQIFTSIVPLVNGQIFIAGSFSIGSGTSLRQNVARINADGSLDLSFNFSLTINSMATIRKVTVQSTGKIIITGNFTGFTDASTRNANYAYDGIARLNLDGSIDQTFQTVSTFTFSNYVSDIGLLSDDRILVDWLGISNNNYYNKNYVEFFGKDGGIDGSLVFPSQYGSIVSIFKEKTDQFLLVGSMSANGATVPITRFKKN